MLRRTAIYHQSGRARDVHLPRVRPVFGEEIAMRNAWRWFVIRCLLDPFLWVIRVILGPPVRFIIMGIFFVFAVTLGRERHEKDLKGDK